MKRWSRVKIVNTLVWLFLLLVFAGALGFVSKEEKKMKCSGVDIRIRPETESYFIAETDIAKLLTGDGNVAGLAGRPLHLFNVGEIEKSILLNPYIDDAEVFCDIDGALRIEVKQRQPLIRVFRQGSGGYYIDLGGKKMPLSPGYSARVLIASGNIYEKYTGKDSLESQVAQHLYKLALFISRHEFWSSQIDEIYVNAESEFVLIPKVGDHRILMGGIQDMEDKFRKLWIFYKKALDRVGWETYKVINLKYTGQIVCEK
jgi:cell division protein FtsQ